MAIDYNVDALKRELVPAGTWGNVTAKAASYTAVAMAQNEVAALCKLPANCKVIGLIYNTAALGATTVLEFGYEAEDGTPSDPDAFADVADASSAASGFAAIVPVEITEDSYLTVKQTGAGTGAGVISATVLYIYTNK